MPMKTIRITVSPSPFARAAAAIGDEEKRHVFGLLMALIFMAL
jgi:hypothetical protein